MDWTLVIAAFILGLALGYVACSIYSGSNSLKSDQRKAEQALLELDQYKQSTTDLHQEHAQQLMLLSEQVIKINRRWNASAKHLELEIEGKPLPESFENHSSSQERLS